MRLLIYGAGVIGSLYAVLFSNAGYHVSIYARGQRLHFLQTRGLLYRKNNKIQKGNTHIIDTLKDDDNYDFIFLTVREEHLKIALTELKNNCSKTIVTMVNTIEKYSELENFCGKGRILPAFPGAGGSIENGILDAALTPWVIQPTTFGEINGQNTERALKLSSIFRKSKIPYQIVPDMHKWQLSHLGMVVPIADAYYKSNNPQYVYNESEIMQKTVESIKRNFRWLAKHKSLSPKKFYLFMMCPDFLFHFILRLIYKSSFGYRFMYQHSLNAPQEMRELHKQLYSYIESHS